MVSDEPLILLSNDDGVEAEGLQALRASLLRLGRVVVVAPATDQSARSHSLTLVRPLRHQQVASDTHAIDGTPADCIYVALYRARFLPRWPDLVCSGINHGYNLGSDTFYSGTVAAAREAALRGIPALALSCGHGRSLSAAATVAGMMAERMLSAEYEGGVLLNVNFPPDTPYQGIKPTRLGRRTYVEEVTVRRDPRGKEYFWIGSPEARHERMDDSDTDAVDSGKVSVTPLSLDGTDASELGLAAWVSSSAHAGMDEE